MHHQIQSKKLKPSSIEKFSTMNNHPGICLAHFGFSFPSLSILSLLLHVSLRGQLHIKSLCSLCSRAPCAPHALYVPHALHAPHASCASHAPCAPCAPHVSVFLSSTQHTCAVGLFPGQIAS